MNFVSSLTCMALASAALASAATACAGSTKIGESGEGADGAGGTAADGGTSSASGGSMSDGSTSTNGSAGSGGHGGTSGGSGGQANPCEERPCGASCSMCDAADMNCTTEIGDMFCNAAGECTSEYPTCQPEQCETAMDCPQPGAPCEACPDGNLACPFVDCVNGRCVGSFPSCTTTTCMTDDDCPASLAPCQMCADGSVACPYARCEAGTCVNGIEACGDDDPCSGKACGDTCSTCDPASGVCNEVLMYCDENLECQLNQPMCNAMTCVDDLDCPGVGACPSCDDAGACAELRCVDGACKFQCPDAGMCSEQYDSCASGETCCSGLTCCAGVPIPEGSEYCSDNCPISDVNLKRNFVSVDPDEILEQLASLPIGSWSYRTESPRERHIGPMAQDFMAAFDVGSSDRTILQVDADGVAFAAIQALHARLERLEARNQRLEQELSKMTACSSRNSPTP